MTGAVSQKMTVFTYIRLLFNSPRGPEKMLYLASLPGFLGWTSYKIYMSKVIEQNKKLEKLAKTEEKFLEAHAQSLVKLQNFKQRVYAVGIQDDILDGSTSETESLKDKKLRISKNAALIRDLIRETQPEQVVLEMCDERYEEEIGEIVSHPNFDATFSAVQKLLSRKRP